MSLEEAFDFAGPVEHSDDLDPAFKQSVKYKVLGEPFQWKHPHAGEEGAPVRSHLADFGLARLDVLVVDD